MKYASLIWAGLWRKPLRTTFTMLSLMMAFVLFGLLQSVSAGLDHLVASSQEDRLFVFAKFGIPQFPIAYKNQIERVPGVVAVDYQVFLGGYVGDPKNFFFVGGANETYLENYPALATTPEQRAALRNTPDGIIISTTVARRLGLKVGDRVPLTPNVAQFDGKSDWSFQVLAIVDRPANPGVDQFSFGNYQFLNENRGAAGKDIVSQFAVTISDPKKAAEISGAIDTLFENSSNATTTVSERVAMATGANGFGNIGFFVTAIVGCVMTVLLLLTVTTMIQSVNERTTEFGVLKTLGFSDRQVLGFIFTESLLQCLVGAGIGLVIPSLIAPFLQGKIPGPPIVFHVPWVVTAAGVVLALVVAILSAAVPAVRVARLQIVDALAGR